MPLPPVEYDRGIRPRRPMCWGIPPKQRSRIMLGTQDVCALGEFSDATLADWRGRELVTPTIPGRSREPARYDSMAALGLVVAGRLRQSRRGCSPVYVGVVFRAFATMSERELEAEFAKGNT